MKKLLYFSLILSVGLSTVFNIDHHLVINTQRKINRTIASSLGFYDFQKELAINYVINNKTKVFSLINQVSTSHMNQTVEKLVSFPTRHFQTKSGELAFDWIAEYWYQLTTDRNDIELKRIKHSGFNQRSIILEIKGSDQILSDEIIVIGAHGDSINTDSSDINAPAPGANDNAAGVAVVTELLRIIIENNYIPKRSIHLIIYAAEEVNMQGSYDIAKRYREEAKKVIGVLNLDGVNDKQDNDIDITLIDDSTSKEQNIFLGNLIDTYLQKKWTWQTCGYGCSDHAGWNYEGYRASFPFEGLLSSEYPYLHTSNDTFDKVNFSTEHASIFAKLAISYFVELDK